MTDLTPDAHSLYLGLPPGRRPPHYYELLELDLFCSHYERIHHAVRKQFRLIKPYQAHPERAMREAVQEIMSAIATARIVLTDPRQKESYDRALAAELNIDRDQHLAKQIAAPLPELEMVVIAGPSLVDERVELVEGTAYCIGSDVHCALPLTGGRVGERHFRVEFLDGDWWVRSIDSSHTIYVNNEACGECVLNDQDFIDAGGYRLKVVRIDLQAGRKTRNPHLPPPLSMIILRGLSIPAPMMNVLPPQRVLIGQADTALWQLPDRTVSQHHCGVHSVGDRWEVEDLGSTNGTHVNGTEIMRHILNDRDVLTVGRFDILISLRF